MHKRTLQQKNKMHFLYTPPTTTQERINELSVHDLKQRQTRGLEYCRGTTHHLPLRNFSQIETGHVHEKIIFGD